MGYRLFPTAPSSWFALSLAACPRGDYPLTQSRYLPGAAQLGELESSSGSKLQSPRLQWSCAWTAPYPSSFSGMSPCLRCFRSPVFAHRCLIVICYQLYLRSLVLVQHWSSHLPWSARDHDSFWSWLVQWMKVISCWTPCWSFHLSCVQGTTSLSKCFAEQSHTWSSLVSGSEELSLKEAKVP